MFVFFLRGQKVQMERTGQVCISCGSKIYARAIRAQTGRLAEQPENRQSSAIIPYL